MYLCRLNAVVKGAGYSILMVDKCIKTLVEAQAFSTLNVNFLNRQIGMDDKDVFKFALNLHHELVCCTKMPFGLNNAHELFQQVMIVIPSQVKRQLAIVSTDNVDFL